MGLYNTYGNVQMKCGDYRQFQTYKIGDKCDLEDGIYIGWEGAIVIKDGKFVAEFPTIHDKFGTEVSCKYLTNLFFKTKLGK